MQAALHFTTQNVPLAKALCHVGFKMLAIWNRYTDAKLASLGYRSVRAAKEAGKPGILTFVFERRDDLQAALDSWDAAGVLLREKKPLCSTVDTKNAMPIVRATMYLDEPFDDLWKDVPAQYLQGGFSKDAEGNVSEVSMKVVSDNLPDDVANQVLES